MSKSICLNTAIEITKEAARAGNQEPGEIILILEQSYKKLLELEIEVSKE